MQITLSPKLEKHVRTRLDSGLYNNADDVVADALRFMETHEAWIQELKLVALREQLQLGMQQLDQGKGMDVTSPAALDTLFERTTQ